MSRLTPLTYTVHHSDKDGQWKVWKGGAMTGRPSRVFERKKEAVEYGREQMKKYNADALVIQKKNGRLSHVVSGPFEPGNPYSIPDAGILVEWNSIDTSFGWMIASNWDDGLLAYGYGSKKQAVDDAKTIMYKTNAYRVKVYNQSGGSKESYNRDLDRSDVPF